MPVAGTVAWMVKPSFCASASGYLPGMKSRSCVSGRTTVPAVAVTELVTPAIGSVSSVQVPAVSAAVEEMRISPGCMVAIEVRSLPLLPVKVPAVPPEPLTVKERAGKRLNVAMPAVKPRCRRPTA